jgi:hypothetical protein
VAAKTVESQEARQDSRLNLDVGAMRNGPDKMLTSGERKCGRRDRIDVTSGVAAGQRVAGNFIFVQLGKPDPRFRPTLVQNMPKFT